MNELAVLTLVAALCWNGHPAKRMPDVTYGGVAPHHGYVRDHKIPLCAGGPDTRDNIQYQTYRESKLKDGVEHRACEAMCAGRITQPEAQEMSRHWREYIRDESWWHFIEGKWR